MRAIHQFHPAVSQGDAITDDIIALQKIVRSWGFDSEIFCQYPTTGIPTRPYGGYASNSHPRNILLLHFSIAYSEEVFNFIEHLPDQKVLVYHNITPAHYFTGVSAVHERECVRGRAQLPRLAQICSQGIGDSEFNCLELQENGFSRTCVVPILVNFEKFKKTVPSQSILSRYADGHTNILFVGRFVPNKRHDEILRAFAFYQRFLNPSSRLFLVGKYDEWEGYFDRLQAFVQTLGCREVFFPGHTSLENLVAYYRLADLFLCRSEHEGFCVPLLESMFFRVPIVAFSAGAVSGTLGDGGVLVDDRDPLFLAETIHYILSYPEVKEEVLRRQDFRLNNFSRGRIEVLLKNALSEGLSPVRKAQPLSVLIEGTFEDSYSLSVVNRNLGLALDRQGVQVGFHATSGLGDYVPDFSKMTNPRVKQLWERKIPHPDVSIRNIHPLRIHDMKGRFHFVQFAWEETRVPEDWVTIFNQLDGVIATSYFVKDVLISCGVKVPIRVVPHGLDSGLIQARPGRLPFKTNKRFVFLNVGSAFPRKGLDVLLSAFNQEFTSQDDVCLVIKSFPNIHNRLKEMLASFQQASAPEVIYLEEENMSWATLASLYARADCFVSPTRGEGFGLPLAEAMYFKVPVIVTNYGGHLDFCNEQTAVLIPYRLVPSRSHLAVPEALWAEPSESDLRLAMRRVYEQNDSVEIQLMVGRAYQKVTQYCSWEGAAEQVLEFIQKPKAKIIRLGMVTTWNQRCGIAEYSKYFLEALPSNVKPQVFGARSHAIIPDSGNVPFVIRCWDPGNEKQDLSELLEAIRHSGVEVVHFQFNFGLFNLSSLVRAIEALKELEICVVLTFHSVRSVPVLSETLVRMAPKLKAADLLLVHTKEDKKYLAGLGLDDKVKVLPHGQVVFPNRSVAEVRAALRLNRSPVIATFGFFLPNKGILETLHAINILRRTYPEILFLIVSALYPAPESQQYLRACEEELKRLNLQDNVLLFTDFLPVDEIAPLLQAADLLVMPYTTSTESTSAAVRFGLAALRPILVTDLPIFSEFSNEIIRIPSAELRSIVEGIKGLLLNPDMGRESVERIKSYIENHSWARIGKSYSALIESMLRK